MLRLINNNVTTINYMYKCIVTCSLNANIVAGNWHILGKVCTVDHVALYQNG